MVAGISPLIPPPSIDNIRQVLGIESLDYDFDGGELLDGKILKVSGFSENLPCWLFGDRQNSSPVAAVSDCRILDDCRTVRLSIILPPDDPKLEPDGSILSLSE